MDAGQIITTGVLNVRRFEQRATETLVLGELLDRTVRLREDAREDLVTGTVYDVAMEQGRNRDWFLTHVAVREPSKRFGRRGQSRIAEWSEVEGLVGGELAQRATHLLATMDSMRPADVADALRALSPKRRAEIVADLDDERLADVLEESPEANQVEIIVALPTERAARVLEEMSPDDAADLIGELPTETAEQLLALMEPDEAEDVRRLLVYEEHTAGGMMTTEPVVLGPDATVAEALARVRDAGLPPSLAAMVYVCRPPLETPTGKFLGVVHLQRLLREPPSSLAAAAVDNDLEWPRPESQLQDVARIFAAYNMVASPVVDENGHLVGALTVDDLLDHLLPDDWRERPVREVPHGA